jgi:hypothetical protein
MKNILLLCSLMIVTLVTFGQEKTKVIFNAGVENFMPLGTLDETHYFGVGGNLEMDVRPEKSSFSFFGVTGYDYILGKDGNKSFLQIPTLIGVRLHLDSIWSISQGAGISFFNEAIGFKQTYSSSIRFNVGKLCIDGKYVTSIITGHNNDISGFILRIAYKIN